MKGHFFAKSFSSSVFSKEALNKASVHADCAEEFSCNQSAAHFSGMHSVPGDIGRVAVDQKLVERLLHVDVEAVVFFCSLLAYLDVFVESLPHHVIPLRLHEEGGQDDHSLHLGERLFDQLREGFLIFGKINVGFCYGGHIILTPYVVYTDHHADPVGLQVHDILLPSFFQITDVIAASACVHNPKFPVGIDHVQNIVDLADIAVSYTASQSLTDGISSVRVGYGVSDEYDFVTILKKHTFVLRLTLFGSTAQSLS